MSTHPGHHSQHHANHQGPPDSHAETNHPSHDVHAGHQGHAAAMDQGTAQPHADAHAGHDASHSNHGAHDSGHSEHAGHGADHVAQFRRLFWIMLVLAIPVVGLNEMFANLLGYQLPDAEWVRWVSPLLGTVIYLWGGRPFLTGAISEIRSRKPGMMLLIALAMIAIMLLRPRGLWPAPEHGKAAPVAK